VLKEAFQHAKATGCDLLEATIPKKSGGRRQLTSVEKESFTKYAMSFREYKQVVVQGVLFRAQEHQRPSSRHDNTGVMMPYTVEKKVKGESVETQEDAFGRILRIYQHQLSETSAVRVVFEVQWFTLVEKLYDGELPVVRYDKDDTWHKRYKYQFVEGFWAQNVAFWPRDIYKPEHTDLCAIWSRGAHRILDTD
jgi:hypothetical protein